MKIVVKISGHLISSNRDKLVNYEYLMNVANVLRRIKEMGHNVYAVCGGGFVSREYINVARSLGANESQCDEIGIEIARIHARLLINALGDYAYPLIPKSIDEFLRIASITDKVVVMGGFHPGQSTTTVAALVAEAINADLLIITSDVDGIYTSDPKKDPNARKLDKVHINQLEEIFRGQEVGAGLYKMVDPITLLVLRRSKIPTRFINGMPPENIMRVIKGEELGTLVYY